MNKAIKWFKGTVTGKTLYSKGNEGYKDFEVALRIAKKEVFDDLIKKIEWLKLILSGTVMTKEKDIYYWIDKAFEDTVEKSLIGGKR